MSELTLPTLIFSGTDQNAPAVISSSSGGAVLSRADLWQSSTKVADSILEFCRIGTNADDNVVIAMAQPNGLAFILTFLGVTARSAVAAPLNPAYTVPEFEFYLTDTQASALVVDDHNAHESFAGIVAARKLGIPVCTITSEIEDSRTAIVTKFGQKESIDVQENSCYSRSANTGTKRAAVLGKAPNEESTALILHTSGTTGKPKAVPLSHKNLACSALNVAQSYDLGASDRGYLIQVLFHIHGIVASLLAPLVSHGSVVVPNKFDANVTWDAFTQFQCTWLSGTPSALQILLHSPKAGPHLGIKFLRSCSSPLLPSTYKKLFETFNCPILEAYAMTENAHQMTTNTLTDVHPGSVGKASGTVKLRIFGSDVSIGPLKSDTEGEICISGPSITRGYVGNPEANGKSFFLDSDGTRWFRTGDMGIIDTSAGDSLRIVGRKSEIINRGGEKISPPEVDEALMLCSASHVKEAVCFAVPDEFFGQEIEAAVVLSKDAPKNLDENELQRLLQSQLAAFKIPKRIHFIPDAIPKGPTGKIQRAQLSQRFFQRKPQATNVPDQVKRKSELPEQVITTIAESLRIEKTMVNLEITLLELGADSMNLTRLLGELRKIGCSISMSDVILNPSVKQVIEMCKSSIESRSVSRDDISKRNSRDDLVIPAPFSILQEELVKMKDQPHIDAVLNDVANQIGVQKAHLEEVLPLSIEQSVYMDVSSNPKWMIHDTSCSFATVGNPIKPSVDLDKLRWAFNEVAKVEPMPRSFMAQIPGSSKWLHVIVKPETVVVQWKEWSAKSRKDAYERLQLEHEKLRYFPGMRASKMLVIHYPGEEGEECRELFFVETHILTDNVSRSMLRDNVVKLYLGQATIDTLPQIPLATSLQVQESFRIGAENYHQKMSYWDKDAISHAVNPNPSYLPPPELGIKPLIAFKVGKNPLTNPPWSGDLTGLTLEVGLTAPTLLHTIMPLVIAAFEYQGTGVLPLSVCYNFVRSGRSQTLPNSEQIRGLGVAMVPFRMMLSLAQHSLWLHIQQSSLKLSDCEVHFHMEAFERCQDTKVQFVWRELPTGSLWSSTIDAEPERLSTELPAQMNIIGVRLGPNELLMINGETDEYSEWRRKNGFPIDIITVFQRCLNYLCKHKYDLTTKNLNDLINEIWN